MGIKKMGIYVHIPFCIRKCNYCDFCSIPYDRSKSEQYIQMVKRQMNDYKIQAASYTVDTIYFGGGTPTVPDIRHIAAIVKHLKKNFHLAKYAEITVEANPALDLKKKFKKLKAMGVNRLSIGLQSAHNKELQALGRLHDREQFETAYASAVKAKFDNINVDLMFGIPEQTLQSFEESLDFVLNLEPSPQHISCYGLKIEEGTPFYREKETLRLPDEDTEAKMYELACEKLRQAGFLHYEISNFAQKGFESHHNLKYWECEEYLGFGAAASSYFGDHRFTAVRDVEKYISAMQNNTSCMAEISDDPFHMIMGDYIMLNLRLSQGVSYFRFQNRFKRELKQLMGTRTEKYVKNGFLEDDGTSLRLTEKGFYISNYILSDLLNFENNIM